MSANVQPVSPWATCPPPYYTTPGYPNMSGLTISPHLAPAVTFYIRTHLNDLVLGIKDGSGVPGAQVVTVQKKECTMSQLWYNDTGTCTIRSRLNDFCMELTERAILVVNPYSPMNPNQRFEHRDQYIHCCSKSGEVLDIMGFNEREGTTVHRFEKHNGNNQKWHIDNVDSIGRPIAMPEIKYFYIRTEMHHKVMDVCSSDPNPGASVVMWPRKSLPTTNQLWYCDSIGVIHSALNHFVLDGGSGCRITMQPYNATNAQQKWILVGQYIVNQSMPDQCLAVGAKNMADGAGVIASANVSGYNQHWSAHYIN